MLEIWLKILVNVNIMKFFFSVVVVFLVFLINKSLLLVNFGK